MDEMKIDIATAMTQLRTELLEAIDQGEKSYLKFDLKEVEVEFKCSVRADETAKLGFKFWLINGQLTGKDSEEIVQTVKLKLDPQLSGKSVQLSDEDNPR